VKIDALRARPRLRAIGAGVRFARAHGRAVRRARALCATADALELQRPHDWRRRAQRLYVRVARDLRGAVSAASAASATPVVEHGDLEPGGLEPGAVEPVERRAHRLLHLAQAPYRRMALVIAALVASLVATVGILLLIGSAISPALSARLFPGDLAAGRPWLASSAVATHSRSGLDPSTAAPGPFFHTQDSDHPWIEIDLGAPRVVRRLRIGNRVDCCQTIGLPLNFQIFDQAHAQWRTVVQRRAGFIVWNEDFAPVLAQRVRLQVAGNGVLSLRRVALYSW
jgi:hypothetical protein